MAELPRRFEGVSAEPGAEGGIAMDGQALGRAFDGMISTMALLLVVFVPLGLWKLVEIVWWLFTHVSINS